MRALYFSGSSYTKIRNGFFSLVVSKDDHAFGTVRVDKLEPPRKRLKTASPAKGLGASCPLAVSAAARWAVVLPMVAFNDFRPIVKMKAKMVMGTQANKHPKHFTSNFSAVPFLSRCGRPFDRGEIMLL